MKAWIFLLIAIITEVLATISLKISEGMLWGYATMSFCIILSYCFMGLSIRSIPVGTAYAIWEVIGLCLVVIIGTTVFGEILTLNQKIGIAIGIIGIILINISEKK
ncbi:SMR family transporter [Helicobacter sp. 13S00477-4]|uniref:DMT family transporter n=1 Tax=Helicobacter sp. 13S00477-4 TaxID=1905759 RepID=UPI000BA5A55B|nr:SMR family transporter [Helicobacter sp. 13S00477-4]PAF51244.1 hypothetical protein BKH44_05920 [Helicobacter sp. 13S00477-4]